MVGAIVITIKQKETIVAKPSNSNSSDNSTSLPLQSKMIDQDNLIKKLTKTMVLPL